MSERCRICDKPSATTHDDATIPEGEGEHLCWRTYGADCVPHDWRAECLALRARVAELEAFVSLLQLCEGSVGLPCDLPTVCDPLRAEVERVEAEAASYRRVLVAVRDAMKATDQEPDGDDDPRRPLASLVWRVLKEKDAGAALLAEVERLRGLIRDAEWDAGGYIMGGPLCPWCEGDREVAGHRDDCPAFTARGEVRR